MVNPLLPGFEKAFAEGKFGTAVDEWRAFSQKHGLQGSSLYSGEAYLKGTSIQQHGERTYFTIDRGGVYAVQPSHEIPHSGCLMFCPLIDRPSSMYIHGDYDLFGIVPADMPKFKNVRQAMLFGEQNIYSEQAWQIAEYLNQQIGSPMIQHGSQENSTRETKEDEHLDVFWAGGQVTEAKGRQAIEKLYAIEFRGRATGPQSSGLVQRG